MQLLLLLQPFYYFVKRIELKTHESQQRRKGVNKLRSGCDRVCISVCVCVYSVCVCVRAINWFQPNSEF